MMFQRILVANRGEIALRIIRACKEMGIESVAVYSQADRGAPYLEMADRAIGNPVLIKASAGGGGKGMRVCQSEANLPAALQAARNEAEAAFKNPSVYLEKFIDRPRHVEVQLLADTLGNVVHCWERDCSV